MAAWPLPGLGAGVDTRRARQQPPAAGQARRPTPPAPAPQTPPAQAPQQPPAGRGGGRGTQPGTFPAQQRPPGDPALIERGQGRLLRVVHRLPWCGPPRRTAGRPEPAALAGGAERQAGRAAPADRPRQPRRARHAAAADSRTTTCARWRNTSTACSRRPAVREARRASLRRRRTSSSATRPQATGVLPGEVQLVPLADRRPAGPRHPDLGSEGAADDVGLGGSRAAARWPRRRRRSAACASR